MWGWSRTVVERRSMAKMTLHHGQCLLSAPPPLRNDLAKTRSSFSKRLIMLKCSGEQLRRSFLTAILNFLMPLWDSESSMWHIRMCNIPCSCSLIVVFIFLYFFHSTDIYILFVFILVYSIAYVYFPWWERLWYPISPVGLNKVFLLYSVVRLCLDNLPSVFFSASHNINRPISHWGKKKETTKRSCLIVTSCSICSRRNLISPFECNHPVTCLHFLNGGQILRRECEIYPMDIWNVPSGVPGQLICASSHFSFIPFPLASWKWGYMGHTFLPTNGIHVSRQGMIWG